MPGDCYCFRSERASEDGRRVREKRGGGGVYGDASCRPAVPVLVEGRPMLEEMAVVGPSPPVGRNRKLKLLARDG